MIKHIAFTMYPVTDMVRARRFYEDTLGLRLTRREASEFEWVEYDLDGGTFALTDLKQRRGTQRRNQGEYCLRSPECGSDGGTITREGRTRKARTALNASVSPRSHSRPPKVTRHQVTQVW